MAEIAKLSKETLLYKHVCGERKVSSPWPLHTTPKCLPVNILFGPCATARIRVSVTYGTSDKGYVRRRWLLSCKQEER